MNKTNKTNKIILIDFISAADRRIRPTYGWCALTLRAFLNKTFGCFGFAGCFAGSCRMLQLHSDLAGSCRILPDLAGCFVPILPDSAGGASAPLCRILSDFH